MTPEPARPAPRHHGVAAAVLVAAVCAGWLTAALSHRLDHGGAWWQNAESAQVNDDGSPLVFTFAPNTPVTFGATIRNPRPWPVTITGVANDDDEPFEVVSVTMDPEATLAPAAAVPFEPTKLASGEELALFVTITMRDRRSPTEITFDEFPVAFTALGVPRHQRVPLGYRIEVGSGSSST